MSGTEIADPTQLGATQIVEAMRDGWRVIQFPQQFPAYPDMEYNTSFLKFEYILEKLEEIDDG